MKKIIAIAAATFALTAGVQAQGTLTFVTDLEGDGPFVVDVDGVTKLDSTFRGQIYAGPDANNLGAVGNSAQFGLLGGSPNAAANGIIFDGSVVTVNSVGGGAQGVFQIRAWDGAHATYEAAQGAGAKHGFSSVVTVTFGGGTPPLTPPNTTGFSAGSAAANITGGGFALIPEPTTVALGLLGLGGLVASRRRKNA